MLSTCEGGSHRCGRCFLSRPRKLWARWGLDTGTFWLEFSSNALHRKWFPFAPYLPTLSLLPTDTTFPSTKKRDCRSRGDRAVWPCFPRPFCFRRGWRPNSAKGTFSGRQKSPSFCEREERFLVKGLLDCDMKVLWRAVSLCFLPWWIHASDRKDQYHNNMHGYAHVLLYTHACTVNSQIPQEDVQKRHTICSPPTSFTCPKGHQSDRVVMSPDLFRACTGFHASHGFLMQTRASWTLFFFVPFFSHLFISWKFTSVYGITLFLLSV